MDIIEQYRQNKKMRAQLADELQLKQIKTNKKISDLRYQEYSKKIRALETERDEKISKIEQKFIKTSEQPTKQKMENLSEIIKRVDRILQFIKINKKGDKGTDFELYKYVDHDEEGHYLFDKQKVVAKPIDTLYKDDFANIQVFIEENDKPKNCFSLFVSGRTIFHEKVLDLPCGYLGFIHDNCVTYSLIVKDAPTKNELQCYYEKNKEKLRNAFSEKYVPVKKEYLDATILSMQKEWIRFFLEKQKEYYEHDVSRGTETEEYKRIVEELKHTTEA